MHGYSLVIKKPASRNYKTYSYNFRVKVKVVDLHKKSTKSKINNKKK